MKDEFLFSIVTSPHLLVELLFFVVLGVFLGCDAKLYWIMTAAIGLSLASRAIMAHNWYVANFKDFGTGRKAFVPYIL